ncbi:MAG: hypothetical protein JST30_17115 [Armatimonadetes bacterium]|nr:hypothetical protein [Armatimonadota bacterium]
MPHLQLELSEGLLSRVAVDDLLKSLADGLALRETVDPAAVKAYARVAAHWAMGQGAPESFVHLTVCVLEGRTPEWESETSDVLYGLLAAGLGPVAATASVTLEFRRMERRTYRKGG